MSIFAIGVIVAIIFLARKNANPGLRSFAVGLIAVIGAAVAFLFFARVTHFQQPSAQMQQWQQVDTMARANQQRAEALARDAQARSEAMARSAQERSQAMAQGAAAPRALPISNGPPQPRHSYEVLTAEVKAPTGTQSGGNVHLGFLLFDNQARDCSIDVQYSPDRGNTWFPATEVENGPGISGLSSAMHGARHEFFWNSLADLGVVRNPNVQIRVMPVSSNGNGNPGTSTFFVVDNRRLAARTPKSSAAAPAVTAYQTNVFSAMGKAVLQAWTGHAPTTNAIAAEKPAKSPPKPPSLAAEREDDKSSSPRPDWVNAAPRMVGDVYQMSLRGEPYETQLECERELPRVLQAAVADYASLLLGSGAAKDVRLSDYELRKLVVGEPWFETRPTEFGGVAKDMLIMHVLVGFDRNMQEQIGAAAQRDVVFRRLKGTGLVFGGVLGILALVWSGLSLVKKREVVEVAEDKGAVIVTKRRSYRGFIAAAIIVAFILLAIAWGFLSAPGFVIR